MNVNQEIDRLREWYGEAGPSSAQWERVVSRPADKPITLINFFKFHSTARYENAEGDGVSGGEAFRRYSRVSMPAMQAAGGKFLHVGPFAGSFMGQDEDWDLVAIGSYPNLESFLALYKNSDYRAAFAHRTAACEREKVVICE
ncbi:MAG: DUF1330 domain-containing protein [Leptospirales bacterium]|jgi:uncharacterized protein (DUF1330 family)